MSSTELPSRPAGSTSTPNTTTIISALESWLKANTAKISTFWIGADWSQWTRFELFTLLDPMFNSNSIVTHSHILTETPHYHEIDIFIEPLHENTEAVAIKIRCEKVSENEGSYERFREQMDTDMEQIKGAKEFDPIFEGVRLLFVGFSGPAQESEGSVWQVKPEPKHFEAGEVNGWIMEYKFPTRE